MSTKTIFLCFAVIAIGIFMLPQTLSMFAGQHSWYDPKDDCGIPCEKCHWLESGELTGCAYGIHSPHRTAEMPFECVECHNVSMDVNYYFETGDVGEHTPAHAATTVSCLACHGDLFSNSTHACTTCHADLGSGGVNTMHVLAMKYGMGHPTNCLKCHRDYDPYNITAMRENVIINHVDTELSHPLEGHREFFLGMSGENTTKSESGLSDSNEACLGCHTSVGVNISWNRCAQIAVDVGKSNSKWEIGVMNGTGSSVTFISTDG